MGSNIASLPASDAHTFGLKRTESLAALFSMTSLVILSIGLACEAIRRLWMILYVGEDVEVDGQLMSGVAFIGVIVNVILAFVLGEDHVHMVVSAPHFDFTSRPCSIADLLYSTLLQGSDDCNHGHSHSHHHHDDHHDEESNNLLSSPSKGHSYSAVQHLDEVLPECAAEDDDLSTGNKSHAHGERNVNLHAAYLHVLADLLQSVIVFIAGLIIWYKPTWQCVDPITTLIFSILVCYSTVGPIRSSLSVLLEEVPPGLDWEEIYDAISGVEGVSDVHDLHIWSISHGHFIMSVHAAAEDNEQAYRDIKKICNKKNISHLTVQLQPKKIGGSCVTCMEGSVHQCR